MGTFVTDSSARRRCYSLAARARLRKAVRSLQPEPEPEPRSPGYS